MCPTVIELRTLNPILNNFSDREIEDFIIFLKESGFEWIGSKKFFYHSKLQFSLRTQGLDLFVRDRQAVKNRISKSEIKQRESPVEYSSIIRELTVWKNISMSALIFGVAGLLLGRIIFSFKMWIFYEIFCFASFIISGRVQGALLRKINKWVKRAEDVYKEKTFWENSEIS